jgi:hypothetical protein
MLDEVLEVDAGDELAREIGPLALFVVAHGMEPGRVRWLDPLERDRLALETFLLEGLERELEAQPLDGHAMALLIDGQIDLGDTARAEPSLDTIVIDLGGQDEVGLFGQEIDL